MDTQKKSLQKCVVSGCVWKKDKPFGTLYRFPKCASLLQKWCANLRLDIGSINSKTRICGRHFDCNFLRSNRIKKNGLPTIALGYEDRALYLNEVDEGKRKSCDVKNCASDAHSKYFALPTKSEMRARWLAILPLDLSNKKVLVCDKHFSREDIGGRRLKLNAIPLPLQPEEDTIGNKSRIADVLGDNDDMKEIGARGGNREVELCITCEEYAKRELDYMKRNLELSSRCKELEKKVTELEEKLYGEAINKLESKNNKNAAHN